MPCFRGNINNNQIIIDVFIVSPPITDNTDNKEKLITINDDVNLYKALVDTGAQTSCISNKVVKKLSLISKGCKTIQGVQGSSDFNNYIVDILVPISEHNIKFTNTDLMQINKHLTIKPWVQIEVIELGILADNFDVILGMDILKDFSTYIYRNEFTICY